MKSSTLIGLLAIMTVTCASFATAQTSKSDSAAADKHTAKPVASMGAVAVTQDELAAMLQTVPAEAHGQLKTNPAVLEKWLRSRLASEALLNQARQQKWAERAEVKQAIETATRDIVMRSYLASVSQPPESYPSEAEIQAAYEQNKDRFRQPKQVQIAQIYLAASESDPAAMERVKKEAEGLVRKAKAKGADFSILAKKHSQDVRTAEQGGNIGLMPETQLLPEVRQAIASMKKGDISPVIRTGSGFHVLKLIDEREPQTATLSQVKEQLRAALRRQRQEQTAQAYLESLLDTGKPNIDSEAVNAALSSMR